MSEVPLWSVVCLNFDPGHADGRPLERAEKTSPCISLPHPCEQNSDQNFPK